MIIYGYSQFFLLFLVILCQFWLLQVISFQVICAYYKWFLTILNYFILSYFQLCETIVSYFWLLKVISPYVIIHYSKLYYHRLFVIILLAATVGYCIGGYFINGYQQLFYWWHSFNGYSQLLVIILLVAIIGFSISGYYWILHYKPLVVILLVVIDGYFISDILVFIFYCFRLYYDNW